MINMTMPYRNHESGTQHLERERTHTIRVKLLVNGSLKAPHSGLIYATSEVPYYNSTLIFLVNNVEKSHYISYCVEIGRLSEARKTSKIIVSLTLDTGITPVCSGQRSNVLGK